MKRLTIALTLVALAASFAEAQPKPAEAGRPSRAWSPEILDAAGAIAVQDEGRVKPLSTMAAFSLLRINHKRKCVDPNGTKREPMEWLLDTLFYPEIARRYPIFMVETYEVLDAAGIPHEGKKKRDRYTYMELVSGRRRVMELGHEYSRIDNKDRTPVQRQMVNLAHNLHEFERLVNALEFAREKIDGKKFSEVFAHDARKAAEKSHTAHLAAGLSVFPPLDPEVKEWDSAWDFVGRTAMGAEPSQEHMTLLTGLEAMVEARERNDLFLKELEAFAATSNKIAEARGEYGKIELEVSFYKLDPFTKSLVFYLIGFLLVAVTWLKPNLKWVLRASMVMVGIGLVIHTTGITMRCILRSRPPVSTLYETVLFIGGVAVLSALIVEWINKRRIGAAVAPALGLLSLFIAMKFEEVNRTDTMPRLVAVLDTNFWLATHVTCITIGYSAGLLAAAFAHLYIVGKIFGLKKNDDGFYRSIGRMVYGTLCFSLIFSVVGTILGGVWANDSWGRFWGWDPKENGALMIVLAQLAILHARMGGYIKSWWISWSAIVQGCIVAFSWWGVNLLGIGLHSYGFTDGIWTGLLTFYAIEGVVLSGGVVWWLSSNTRPPAAGAAA